MRKMNLNNANRLFVVEPDDVDKENIHSNQQRITNMETTFHQLEKPTLSIDRKHLQKIEKQIALKRYTAPEPQVTLTSQFTQNSQNFSPSSHLQNGQNTQEISLNPNPSTNPHKTISLFSKAQAAISSSAQNPSQPNTNKKPRSIKPREIQPAQKRSPILHSKKADPKEQPSIPFSQNRYSVQGTENWEKGTKKAVKFLQSQKEKEKVKQRERQELIQRRKQYNEKVRRENRQKLSKRKSIDEERVRRGRQPIAQRSKSEDAQTKSHKVVRKYARNRLRQINRSENKHDDHVIKNQRAIKTLSVDSEPSVVPSAARPPKKDPRVQINVDLTNKISQPQREIINLRMDNSGQKISITEEDTKYIKTPELNLQEKYSHHPSDNKISGKSTSKDGKTTKRFLSSHKKKPLKVSKQVIECKKDLVKLQKRSEYRKRKKEEEETKQKEIERRKNNLAALNEMLKKRNQSFKKKRKHQERVQKRNINFTKPLASSFNKKSRKKKLKTINRNQTFSNLSNKSPCETTNTSKYQFSSQKKKFPASTAKKLTYKKMNESLKTNTSSKKLRSDNKLGTRSANASQFLYPNRGYSNSHSQKRKTVKSETKKIGQDQVVCFNDISEIQEFNMTDEEESLINTSILKNIEEHDSLQQNVKLTGKKGKSTKKSIQSSKKRQKKVPKKPKLKLISSSKKTKKSKKSSERGSTLKKRKVIFHTKKSKQEGLPVEQTPGEFVEQNSIDQDNDYVNIVSTDKKDGQIKKVEFSQDSVHDSIEVPNQFNMEDDHLPQTIDKIDMIDSERLSELLSSKKKHRYQEVKDSLDGVAETNIHQQINFTDEEENLKIHSYHSPGVDSPDPQQSLSQNLQNIQNLHDYEHLQDQENHNNLNKFEGTQNFENFKDLNIAPQPEKEFIIESMTYQQIQDEKNDLIEDPAPDSEHQTVINCTQSDQESSFDSKEASRLSDKNVIDDSSLEYAANSQTYNPVAETIPHEEIREQQIFDYEQPHSLEEENEGENSQPEITSRKEIVEEIAYPEIEQNSGPHYYPDSNESYSEEEINDDMIDKFLNEPPMEPEKEGNAFEKTLSNMRLAFGSEQHIRENSVKTLEKLDQSQKESDSGEKTEEKSSVFEKNSFQDFSLKKFTELMNVKNMKNFKTSMQKTFREYNKANLFTASDKKSKQMSSTPKKSSCISPRKFSMKDLELDRIGYEKMKENSEKKNKFIQNIMGSSSSQNKHSQSSILYKTNLSLDK